MSGHAITSTVNKVGNGIKHVGGAIKHEAVKDTNKVVHGTQHLAHQIHDGTAHAISSTN